MNDIEDFFQGSSGAGIDNDNFTNPGSGEGFDSGSDFVPPPPAPTPSRDRDRNTSQNDDDDDEPDFEAPIPSIPFQLSDADREEQDPIAEIRRSLEESEENSLPENSIVFNSEYYLEQYPDLQRLQTDALTHFETYGLREDREYRFALKSTPSGDNIFRVNYRYKGIDLFLHFDEEYYLQQNPELAADTNTRSHFRQEGLSQNREHRYIFVWDRLRQVDNELIQEDIDFWDRFIKENAPLSDSEDSLSGAGENVVGGEQDFDSTMVSESESEPVLDPEVKTARMDFFQDYLTSGIEGSIADTDLGLGTTSYINSDEVSLEPSDDSLL